MAKKQHKETAFDRVLRKSVGLNPGMQVRDFLGVNIFTDMKESHVDVLKDFLEIEVGDHLFIATFKWKSATHRKAAENALKRIMKKHGFTRTRAGKKRSKDFVEAIKRHPKRHG